MKILKHVCGENGKTYNNKCLMKCDGVELKKEGSCPLWKLFPEKKICTCPMVKTLFLKINL